jgi:hypothetical protein
MAAQRQPRRAIHHETPTIAVPISASTAFSQA